MNAKKITLWRLRIATLGMFAIALFPSSALAAGVSVHVSASSIESLGNFSVTMTSTGVSSCTWSRLDNGTTWAWLNQPLPTGTSYDSGVISGWAGENSYKWTFKCSDSTGGTYSGSASLFINAPTVLPPPPPALPMIGVTPPTIYFGSVNTGSSVTSHFTVTNTGEVGTLLSGDVRIATGTGFACISGCSFSNVPVGTPHDVVVKFAPTAGAGNYSTIVTFTGGGDITREVSGTATTPPPPPPPPAPIIGVTPPTINFGSVDLGSYVTSHFTVTNIGAVGTLLTGVISINPSTDFSCVSGCSYNNIPVGTQHDVIVKFKPVSRAGTLDAVATFTGGGSATRTVSGIAVDTTPPPPPPPVTPPSPPPPAPSPVPVIAVTPPTIFFNGVNLGESRIGHFTIKNVGPAGTQLSGVVTVQPGTDFVCVLGCLYNNIASGDTRDVTIRFRPNVITGLHVAWVDFTGGGGATRYLNGVGIDPTPPLTNALDFGTIPVGTKKTLDLVITNPSNHDLGNGDLVVAGPFRCATSCAYSLPPHGSVTIPITFTPVAKGPSSLTATLSDYPLGIFSLAGVGATKHWFRFMEK